MENCFKCVKTRINRDKTEVILRFTNSLHDVFDKFEIKFRKCRLEKS
jgi:hypothetical protein